MKNLGSGAKAFLVIIMMGLILVLISISIERGLIASSDIGPSNTAPMEPEPLDEDTETVPEQATGEFEAEIEFQHDLLTGKDMFVKVQIHPADGEWPGITGDYVETTISCVVRIRGISVPSGCQTTESRRGRPMDEIRRERERWSALLDYEWSILRLHKKLKLKNPVLLQDGVVVCDVFFYLGETWHDLGVALTNDEHARPAIADEEWNWGSLNVDLYAKEQ